MHRSSTAKVFKHLSYKPQISDAVSSFDSAKIGKAIFSTKAHSRAQGDTSATSDTSDFLRYTRPPLKMRPNHFAKNRDGLTLSQVEELNAECSKVNGLLMQFRDLLMNLRVSSNSYKAVIKNGRVQHNVPAELRALFESFRSDPNKVKEILNQQNRLQPRMTLRR